DMPVVFLVLIAVCFVVGFFSLGPVLINSLESIFSSVTLQYLFSPASVGWGMKRLKAAMSKRKKCWRALANSIKRRGMAGLFVSVMVWPGSP
ncbi:MAG: hypothetical protein OEZ36_09285, partial [Spirochaetota bacterium]|nr:hypothetical protein [Spirochaetota bacterium]